MKIDSRLSFDSSYIWEPNSQNFSEGMTVTAGEGNILLAEMGVGNGEIPEPASKNRDTSYFSKNGVCPYLCAIQSFRRFQKVSFSKT